MSLALSHRDGLVNRCFKRSPTFYSMKPHISFFICVFENILMSVLTHNSILKLKNVEGEIFRYFLLWVFNELHMDTYGYL